MKPAELSVELCKRGLPVTHVEIGHWQQADREAVEAWIKGGPVPDWLYGFDYQDVLPKPAEVKNEPPKKKPKQRSLFED